jgi:hypothetical protein
MNNDYISKKVQILTCILLFGISFACTNGNQEKPRAKEGAENNPEAEGGDGTTGANTGDDLGGAEGGDNSDDAVQALLSDCGGKDFEDAKDDTVIYEKNLVSETVHVKVLILDAEATTTVGIKVTPVSYVQDAKIDVIKPALTPTIEKLLVKKNTGKTTFTTVPISKYSSLSDHAAWEKILCTFVPATKVENERGSKTTAEFDPPVPINLSPRAAATRYEEEIGEKKVFNDLKAKIISSDNRALKGKTEVTGSVTVEKVAANAEIDNGDSGKLQIKSDIAFKVTTNFESPAITEALGLAPEMVYYVSYAKKDLVANILDTKEPLTGKVIFVHK